VERLLKTGKVDSAIGTALSIDDDDRAAKPAALRQIVDHHLADGSIDAAIDVARLMEADPDGAMAELFHDLTGQYNDQRSDALAAIIAAQAAAGDLEGATRLAEGLMEPRTRISARLALARAAFQTGATDLAKAQLVLVLSGVQALEPAPIFATMTLTESADLALRSGEMDIARTHAKAAYRAGTRPTVRRGGDSRPPAPSKMLLLNLATVLHLSGATDQAAPLLKRASVPYKDQGFSTLRSEQLATLLVAQVRLGDKEGAADTRAQLLAMDGIAWDDGRPFLHKAAVSLIDHGFLNEALAIADALEPGQRDDLLGFHGESPAALYAAILAKDPALAPEVLKDSLGARAHFIASLALARSLLAAGQPEKARNVLDSLPADHQRRALSEPKFLMNPICVLSFIALTEDELGLDADAEATRQEGLAFARAQSDPGNQTADILVLAASFPVESTASVSYGPGCIGYHP
jgi:thioredoxin-like negative regulator of GroEL